MRFTEKRASCSLGRAHLIGLLPVLCSSGHVFSVFSPSSLGPYSLTVNGSFFTGVASGSVIQWLTEMPFSPLRACSPGLCQFPLDIPLGQFTPWPTLNSERFVVPIPKCATGKGHELGAYIDKKKKKSFFSGGTCLLTQTHRSL